MRTMTSLRLAVATLLVPVALHAQEPVRPADYARFESPGTATLSPDGRWLAYGVNRVDEQNELRVRLLTRDSTIVIRFGSGATFSGDSRWLVHSVGVSPAERERLTEQKKPVRNRVGLIDLTAGVRTDLDEASAFDISPDGKFLLLRLYPPEGSRGADIAVRDLARGTAVSFGNVTGHAWAPDAALLAFIVETETGAANAVQLYDAHSGTLRVLDSSPSRYRGLAWRDDARDLVVLRALPDSAHRDTAHAAIAWRGLGNGDPQRFDLDPRRTSQIPEGMRISETRTPEWTDDGSIVLLGLRPRQPVRDTAVVVAAETPGDEKRSDVQVWHARDVRIIPQQKAQEQQDLRRTLLAAWHVGAARVVQIGTDLWESARVLEDARYAVETDRSRHAFAAMFGRPGTDVWLIDTRTGERQRVLENVAYYTGPSATGRYLLWFDGTDYWTYDIPSRRSVNITGGLGATFADEQHDYPVELLPPHGIAGWTRGDDSVLLYDRYDVWRVAPDGSGGRRITDGAADRVIHRFDAVEPSDDGIDMRRPLYFTLRGERTKQTGWARLRDGRLERLLLEDARLARLMRADSTETFAFTRERFDDAPDWFVADATLGRARQVTELNPFQSEYAWGRAELIDFTSDAGVELQGVLLYPAGHDPSQKYPMIVYTYEQLSQNVHNYVVPSERSYYNFNVWTAEGYFVLMPDIVYRGRDPGVSALEAVVPAVRSVIARGLVDSTRVGLIGHSWGGYQAAYLPTRTDIFAAAVAGAPITNFLSFAGAIHWTPGIAEFSHWETGQARMGVPYWEDLDAYLRNSPAHMVHELKTPMLMMFGDADGTVDWHQGVEFYNFARRAGREDFVLLVYPGEDHGLRQRQNQIDYHRRILQWFGHWLKGEPPAEWITNGTTWLERKQVLENGG